MIDRLCINDTDFFPINHYNSKYVSFKLKHKIIAKIKFYTFVVKLKHKSAVTDTYSTHAFLF